MLFQRICLFRCQAEHVGISEMKHLLSNTQTQCFDVVLPVLFKLYFTTNFLVSRGVLPSWGRGWSGSGKDNKQKILPKRVRDKRVFWEANPSSLTSAGGKPLIKWSLVMLDDAFLYSTLGTRISYLSVLRRGAKNPVLLIGTASWHVVICCQRYALFISGF